jgi:hypothetical protein
MKIGSCRILLFAVSFFLFSAVKAQLIDSMMNVYAQGSPKEKMHIHFDKQIYNPDETVWYKVYILAGIELSPLSKNVYVEWYDDAGKLLRQTVSPLFQATAKGSFDIPLNYKGNFIHLKAYTRWMLNDSLFLFEKDIVINNGKVNSSTIANNPTAVNIFPEGGDLVYGLTSRVAFKATNKNGLPELIKGFLQNDKNQILDTLKVKHDGMGSFSFQPQLGTKYLLNWTDSKGVKGVTNIPITKNEGAVFNIKTDNEKAIVVVSRTTNAGEAMQNLQLIVHMNQELIYKVAIKMKERLVQRIELPIEELPTGILQFSLFNSQWIPIAERIVFVNNHLHEFNVKMNPITVSLDKRAKNSFEIVVNDTAFTNMSVAITDASIVSADQHTIFSNFLLTNEIKGYVHNPAYYFKSDTDSISAQLDLVMLTNGWRKYDWDKIMAAVPPKLQYLPENNFMSFKGKVFGNKLASNAAPMQLNFIAVGKDSSKNFFFTPVEKDGTFEEKGVFFFDTVKVYYGFNGKTKLAESTQVQLDNGLLRKENNTSINLSGINPFATYSDSLANLRMNYFLSEQEKLRRAMASATLAEVTVKSKVKNPMQVIDERYASGLFSGGDGYSFDLTDDKMIGALDIFTYLQGRVPGLQISTAGGQPTLSWRGANPDLFLNEIRSDVSMIQSMSVFDIAYIKVFRPPFFGAAGGGAGGAIAIYTKKGNDSRKADPNSKGMDMIILAGYSKFKEFYSPSYDRTPTNFDPDIRSTLYWNPYIITNKKTPRFKVEFYNNDISKKLQVVLEGVNGAGKMVRVVKIIE